MITATSKLTRADELGELWLTPAGIEVAKQAVAKLAPWVKANRHFNIKTKAHVVTYPGTDLTGTISVFVAIGKSSWKICKFGRDDQYCMNW